MAGLMKGWNEPEAEEGASGVAAGMQIPLPTLAGGLSSRLQRPQAPSLTWTS